MYILPTDSVNIVTLVLLVLVLLGFALLFIAVHKFLSKWLSYLQLDKTAGAEVIRQDAYKESTDLIDSAREESLRLVAEASTKAKEILAKAEDLSEDSRSELEAAIEDLAKRQEDLMEKTAGELSQSYKDALEEQRDIGLHGISSAAKKIEKSVLDEVSQFEDVVHKETVESEKLLETKLTKEYDKIKSEVDKYKQEEMTKIDNSIFDILKDVTTNVLGRALSMEEHRDLVLGSLEEGKRKNLFKGSD